MKKTVKTPRTELRRLTPLDFDFLYQLESDAEVVKHIPVQVPQTENQTKTRLISQISMQDSLEPFGIWLAETNTPEAKEFVGWFMLMPSPNEPLELGFMIVQKQWGKGYATEICHALIEYAKQLRCQHLKATVNLSNHKSLHVLTKLGFKYKKNIFVPNKVFGGETEVKLLELHLSL